MKHGRRRCLGTVWVACWAGAVSITTAAFADGARDGSALDLPALEASGQPTGGVVVRVGKERIGVGFGAKGPPEKLADGTRRPAAAAAVVRLQNGRVPAAALRGRSAENFLIEPLFATLQAVRAYQQRAAEAGGGGADAFAEGDGDGAGGGDGDGERDGDEAGDGDAALGHIDLLVDRRVPFATLARVLYTLGQCRYGSWHFVLERAGERSALEIAAPRYSDRPTRPQKRSAAYRADLRLTWMADGLRAEALPRPRDAPAVPAARMTAVSGGRRARPARVQITAAGRCPAVPRTEQGLALEALGALVASLGAQNDEPFGLILEPLPATPFGELAAVLVAAGEAAGRGLRPLLAVGIGAGRPGAASDCSGAVAVDGVVERFAAEAEGAAAEGAGGQEKKIDSDTLRGILGGGSE